ncbi:MAG: thioredoxin domain-containing protein, partial [Flavisolibacter sp.]|nr:thioredoxin domain-containing protein [Flavisolibacter sp.]
ATLMNELFVNVKVDREERPDVDHLYMDAVQAITGSGGWPLNVFLTPDGRPFYGGTYYPPRRAFNRASWQEVLQAISTAYREKREEIEGQADNLTEHLKQSNNFGIGTGNDALLTKQKIEEAFQNCMKSADRVWGGFGRAPKFPQTFTIQFLLRYHFAFQNTSNSLGRRDEALQQALLSLDKMMQGGIYDHIGGGFARYSTDTEWLVPHFEKMLYDNALLVTTLSEAYSLTKKETYRQVIEETLAFTERELMHGQGGFFSALDADSEGEEGKFYVWDKEEVEAALGSDAPLFCSFFDITEKGNWEGKNILWIKIPLEQYAAQENINPTELTKLISNGKEKLLQKRSERVRPQLDDKILLSWNTLMNRAYSYAYAATGNEHYKVVAIRNMQFLLKNFKAENDTLLHTWKNGQGKHTAFLDDYSFLIAALIDLAQVTADFQWLHEAQKWTTTVLTHFGDTATPFFFFTPDFQTDILLRKKEIYDGATPSGNAVMAYNLYHLSILLDLPSWRQKADTMIKALGDVAIKYPTSFGVWLSVLFEMVQGTYEIAITGPQAAHYLKEVLSIYLPHRVVMSTSEPLNNFPLLKEKWVEGKTLIYLCEQYACRQPVASVEALKELIQDNNF